jgi:DNA-binding HxlR family transcriptional regulator
MIKTLPITSAEKSCTQRLLALEDTMHVIGGKWKLNILAILSFGSLSFSEMQRRMKGISPKVLSDELKTLESNKIIRRAAIPEKPARSCYELSDYGWTLQALIENMEKWGIEHRNYLFKQPLPIIDSGQINPIN